MVKHPLLLALLLSSSLVQAQTDTTQAADENDGYTRPLDQLTFTTGLDQAVFEHANDKAMDVYDPFESFNRRMYQFNYHADRWVMLPAVRGYKYVTPEVARTGVSNFFSNLGDIGNLMNSLLQLKGEQSMRITARLMFNTTLGVAGLWDPATLMGLPKEEEDFGLTLGHYGTPDGPYIMLPLLGPSNLRDTGGLVVDTVANDSIDFLNVPTASSEHPEITALKMVNARYIVPFHYGQLNSPFEYVKVRYLYTEMRKLKIAD